MGTQNFTIVLTKCFGIDSDEVMTMRQWCLDNNQNRKSSWSLASLPEYDNFITFRFWDKKLADKFLSVFKESVHI